MKKLLKKKGLSRFIAFAVAMVLCVTSSPNTLKVAKASDTYDAGYDISTLLANYQFVVEEDVDLTSSGHTVGAVVVGGTLAMDNTFGDAAIAPSYVYNCEKGSFGTAWHGKYPDKCNTVYYGTNTAGGLDPSIWIQNEDYMDVSTGFTAIKGQSLALSQSPETVEVTAENGVVTIDCTKGGDVNVVMDYATYSSATRINILVENVDWFKNNLCIVSVTGVGATDITYDGYNKMCINGSSTGNLLKNMTGSDQEYGSQLNVGGMNLIWNFPDAEGKITAQGLGGHLVAPGASVDFMPGNYEGGVISKNLSGSAEGHFYPMSLSLGGSTGQTPPEPTATLTVTKTDGTNLLPGSTLTLMYVGQYILNGVTSTSGHTIYASAHSVIWKTTDTACTLTGLADGTYTLAETKSPDGYQYAESIHFTVRNGKVYDDNDQEVTEFTMVDEAKEGELVLEGTKAVDVIGNTSAPNETYNFVVKEGNLIVSEGSVSGAGDITFDKITYGPADIGTHTYKISEVAGNTEDMTYDDTVFTVVVKVEDIKLDKNNQPITNLTVTVDDSLSDDIEFTNVYEKLGKLVVLVRDEDYKTPINGAKVDITDPDGNKVTYTTGQDGTITLDETPTGNYTIKVNTIPEGTKVTVGDNAIVEVYEDQTTNHIIEIAPKVKTGDLIIYVNDQESGDPIKGAKVDVTDVDGVIKTYTTDADGKISIEDTPIGDYGIKVNTIPEGTKVTVGDNATATVERDETTTHYIKITPEKGNLVVIVKNEDTQETVEGVKVDITAPDGTTQTYTTDADGKITINNTPVGDYDIITKEVPTGYKVTVGLTETETVEADDTATHIVYIAPENTDPNAQLGNLVVIVRDKETQNVVQGAKVDITDTEGTTKTYTTNADGKIIINDTEAGDYGIVVNTIPKNNVVTSGDNATAEVITGDTTTHIIEITPEVKTGDLEIIVTDEESGDPVKGATVEVTDPDGETKEYTTDDDGKVTINDTPVGDYIIETTKVPDGYEVSVGEKETVTVEEDDKTTHEVKIVTEKGDLEVIVTDEESGDPVKGATVEITDPDGETKEYTTDDDGKITINDTPVGDYVIETTKVPDDYEVSIGEKETVTVNKGQKTTHEVKIVTEKGDLEVIVTDEESGDPVGGATIEITNPDGSVSEYTTDDDGKVTIKDTPVGEYIIETTKIPDGYKVSVGEKETVTVNKGQKTTHEVKIVTDSNDMNTPDKKTGDLEIIVTDEESGDPVKGATVEVTNPDGTTTKYTTDEDGKVTINDTPVGEYIIETTKVPDGYVVTIGEKETVEVTEGDKTTHIVKINTDSNDMQTPEDSKGNLIVIVQDEKTEEPVKGATVEITDPSGNKSTYKTDGEGKITIKDTDLGEYIIVTTKVPDGYTVTVGKSQSVEVEKDKTAIHIVKIATETDDVDTTTEATTEDDSINKDDGPKTGDTANVMPVMLMLVASAIALMYFGLRRKENN